MNRDRSGGPSQSVKSFWHHSSLALDRGALTARAMQGWDAVRAALNPFAIAQRPKVPTGRGPGRQIVFAVDSSKYR